MKKQWTNVLRIAVTVIALAVLAWTIDVRQLLSEFRQVDLRLLLAAFLLYLTGLVIRAYRWLVLVRALDRRIAFRRLLKLYFVGQFFSTFLPTAFGGDVVRALELTEDTDTSVAVGTVLLDRMSGLMVLFAMGLAVLPFSLSLVPLPLILTIVGVAGGGLLAGALVLQGRFLRAITGRLPRAISLAGEGPLARVHAAITSCGHRAVWSAFGVSCVFNVMNVVMNWLVARALGINLNLGYFFAVTPLIAVSLLVPSLGGWGVREMVTQALFASAGAEKGAAIGVLIGVVALGAGLIGGVVYGVDAVRGLRNRE
jgi:uncharacterized membrane protein YbhN (UPF0104 family)